MIKQSTNHNATIFTGKGSYQGAERKMIYTIVGKDQEAKLVHDIIKIDPKAFVNVLETKALLGNFNMQKLQFFEFYSGDLLNYSLCHYQFYFSNLKTVIVFGGNDTFPSKWILEMM